MPTYEHVPVKVTLTVEVDGHVLTFTESGEAKGGRYDGTDPRATGYTAAETIEHNVRGCVDTQTARALKSAGRAVGGLYPLADTSAPYVRPSTVRPRPVRDIPQA